MGNEIVTAMFLAKGASNSLEAYCEACDAFDGELAFLAHVGGFAEKVEGAYQEIKRYREFDVWMYDVVEKLGEFIAKEIGSPVCGTDDVCTAQLIRLVGDASGGELSRLEKVAVLLGWWRGSLSTIRKINILHSL